MITENDFAENYCPTDVMAFTQARAYLAQENLTEQHLWSIVEVDDGSLYASAGNHIVNNLGYVITKKKWENELEEAIWFDVNDVDDFDDEDMED